MWNPDDVLQVYCLKDSDPQLVVIELKDLQSIAIPYTFYQLVQQPLGLPDLICGD